MTVGKSSARASKKLDQVLKQYECYDHQHAIAILTVDYSDLLSEVCDVLLAFRIGIDFIKKAGGNESEIPKALSRQLRPLGWNEQKLDVELKAGGQTRVSDTHKIDYVKKKVAFDLEWNSKDQTFDRDLNAFRTFFEYGEIAVAMLLTRSTALNEIFKQLGTYTDPATKKQKTYLAKYGASTTHMDQLLRRLRAGRSGGCPVLALGITPKQIDL
jgi:CRISPR-associated protein Csd2